MQQDPDSVGDSRVGATDIRDDGSALDHFLAERDLPPNNPQSYLDIAGQLRALGRLSEAESAARQALKLNPTLQQAYRILGFVARDRKEHQVAIIQFEQARMRAPEDVWNWFEIAQEYRLLGKYDYALQRYKVILAAQPDFIEAYRSMGALESARGNYEEALVHFHAARALAPNNPLSYLDIAGELRILGRFAEADEIARKALALNPDLAQAYRILGFAARDRADHKAAIEHFEEASKRAPGEIWNAFEIAQEYRFIGEYDEALKRYRSIAASRPDFIEAHRSMGSLESARNNHEQALAHFRATRALAPDNPRSYLDIAAELRILGRLAEAGGVARQALAFDPDLAQAYRYFGFAARDRGDHQAAIIHFVEAQKRAPGEIWNAFEIAQEYRLMGQYDEAQKRYNAILAARPDFIEAHRSMGALQQALGDHDAALEHFYAARDLAPADARMHLHIAGELRVVGRLDAAEAAARQALALDPNLPQAYRILGFAARDREDHRAALAHFEDAQERSSGDVWNAFEIAQQYRLLGQYDEAMTRYRAIQAAQPDFVEAYRSMALVENARGNIPAAREHLEAALSCMEKAEIATPGQFLARVADTLVQLGRATEAKQRLEAVQTQTLSGPAAAEIFRVKAAIARKMSDHDAELVALKARLDLLPGQKQAWLALANRQVFTGHVGDAMATIEGAKRNFPNDPDLAMERARALRIVGRLDESRNELRAVPITEGLSAQTRVRLADEFRHIRMLPEARDIARSAVELEPENIHARLSLAQANLDLDGPAVAIADLLKIVASGPFSLDAIFHTSRLLRLTGDPQGSIHLLDAHALDWRSPSHIFQELIQGLIQMGDLARARDCLDRRKAFNGDDDDDLCMELELARISGNVRDIEALLATISGRPLRHSGIAAGVIGIANASRNFEATISAQKDWIAFEPARKLPGMISVADAEFNLGRTDIAFGILDDLRKEFGAAPEIYSMRAQLLKKSGNIRDALGALEEGLQTYPDSVPIWTQHVRLTMASAGLGAAEKLLVDAVPTSHVWHEQRAMIEIELLFERCDHAAALAAMDNFMPAYPAHRAHYYHIGARAALAALDLAKAKHLLSSEILATRYDRRLRRQSSNFSQSLLGQLLDDYRLDTEAVARLHEIGKLPPDDRFAPLLELSRDNPDSTATAITTLIHLRRQNRYIEPSAGPGSAIPRRIAQFWDTRDLPSDISNYMNSWRSGNPGWTHEIFDRARAAEFMAAHCAPDVLLAFRRTPDATLQSDLFRLAWLNEGGGLYVDADDACAGPIDIFMGRELKFVGYQEDVGSVGNNFLATIPAHPVITRALEECTRAILRGDSDMPWLATGPGLLSRSFVRWLGSGPSIENGLREAHILHRSELTKVCVPHCHAMYKNTPLHWTKGLFG